MLCWQTCSNGAGGSLLTFSLMNLKYTNYIPNIPKLSKAKGIGARVFYTKHTEKR